MKRIVVAAHGNLASGFNSALKIIVGKQVEAIDCYTNSEFDLEKRIDNLLENCNDQIVVFTDLYGGSVNNAFIKRIKKYSFDLFTNTTLGLLIDFLVTECSVEELNNRLNEHHAIYCNEIICRNKLDEL